MDPRRGSYAEEPEPHWFGGEQQHPDRPGYPEEEWEYRVPDPRGGAPGGPLGNPGPRYPMGPRPGDHLATEPAIPRDGLPPREPLHGEPRSRTEQVDLAALRRTANPTPAGDGIYRARRPAVAALVGIGAAVLAVPALRILLRSAFGPVMSVSGTIASLLLLVALPLAAIGLYGLATGAARVPDAPVTHTWLRPPLAYLVIGVVLLVAAGFAAH